MLDFTGSSKEQQSVCRMTSFLCKQTVVQAAKANLTSDCAHVPLWEIERFHYTMLSNIIETPKMHTIVNRLSLPVLWRTLQGRRRHCKFCIDLNCIENSDFMSLIIICPTAIAYSMGQVINSVCLCQSVCPSVCLSVCVRALSRWHFLIDFRQKWHRRNKLPKVRTSSLGSTSHHTFPYTLKTASLGQQILKVHATINRPIA